MDIYLDQFTEQVLRKHYDYIFDPNPYPGIPRVRLHQITAEQSFSAEGVQVTPILVWHHKMPVLAYRVGDFTYITDANRIDPEELDKVRGSKVLVLNALRREKHISHFTLEEALKLIEEIQPERAYLTHISHQMGKHQNISRELPEGVELAYDGLRIDL